MDADEYQKLALRTEKTPAIVDFAKYRKATETATDALVMDKLIHASLGICTEAGELQDAIKRHLIYSKDFDPTNVMEECGDLLWYIALALHATGYTMGQAMQRNIAKLRARYPEGFTEEQALIRDLAAERGALELPAVRAEKARWLAGKSDPGVDKRERVLLGLCMCSLPIFVGNGYCARCERPL